MMVKVMFFGKKNKTSDNNAPHIELGIQERKNEFI